MRTNNDQCKNRQLCGAKTRSGDPCRNHSAHGRRRCRMHGGQSLVGAAAPAFKHGRYSKYLPKRLRERYDAAAADPELTSLRQELALVEIRIGELLQRLEPGESGKLWARLNRTCRNLIDARRNGDETTAAKLTLKLGQIIEEGCAQEDVWRELLDAIERKSDLAPREWRRMRDLEQFISAEQAVVLITAVVDAVRKHVTDPRKLSLISRDVGVLLGPVEQGEYGLRVVRE